LLALIFSDKAKLFLLFEVVADFAFLQECIVCHDWAQRSVAGEASIRCGNAFDHLHLNGQR